MDQKRILWIVAAAGVFLLVVFGTAAILYSPKAEPARTIVTNAPAGSTQSTSGWVSPPVATQNTSSQARASVSSNDTSKTESPISNAQNNEKSPSSQTPSQTNDPVTQVNDMTVISQNTNVYSLQQNLNADQSTTTIDLNKAQKPAQQVSGNVTATNQAGATAIAAAQSNTKATSITTGIADPVSASTQKNSAPTQAKKTAVTQYWVQAASFTSKKSADNAVVVLDDNKIPANIFTYKDTKGTLYYRIRVGPYVTKSEAEYWQTRIAKIDTFSESKSYVTSTTSNQ